jgi:DNA-binding GntR family transcriptional regulator
MRKKNTEPTAVLELPRSVAWVAAQVLEKEIIEDRLKPGQRLIEETWAAKLGISQGSFREVLRILEHASLVDIVPRRGARVAELKKRDAEEIYFLRKHLLGLAFTEAARNMSDERLSEFRRILGRMEDANTRRDATSYFSASVTFDDLVLEVAGIRRLKLLLAYLGKPTLRYRFIGFHLPGRLARSLEAHRKIIKAFEAKDANTAGDEVSRIIEEAGKAIIHHLFDATPREGESTRQEEISTSAESHTGSSLAVSEHGN